METTLYLVVRHFRYSKKHFEEQRYRISLEDVGDREFSNTFGTLVF